MIASTVDRVGQNTPAHFNADIRRRTKQSIAQYAAKGPAAIGRRLQELDQEWDIERLLQTNAATAILMAVALGVTVDRKWFMVPGLVGGFLLQHALQGWCPPLPVFRRLGFRTASEINYERYALMHLRGDFNYLTR